MNCSPGRSHQQIVAVKHFGIFIMSHAIGIVMHRRCYSQYSNHSWRFGLSYASSCHILGLRWWRAERGDEKPVYHGICVSKSVSVMTREMPFSVDISLSLGFVWLPFLFFCGVR